jgi:hypothetical protein
LFFHILGIIIPTDYFSEGLKPPTSDYTKKKTPKTRGSRKKYKSHKSFKLGWVSVWGPGAADLVRIHHTLWIQVHSEWVFENILSVRKYLDP